VDTELLRKIERELKNISFGELIVTVHGTRVVQMEVRHKQRIDRIELRDIQ